MGMDGMEGRMVPNPGESVLPREEEERRRKRGGRREEEEGEGA